MKRIITLIAAFVVIASAYLQLREPRPQILSTKPETESVEEHEGHFDKPDEFIKYHRAIRTSASESQPGYAANYQWTELNKAQRYAATPIAKARMAAGTDNGVTAFTERGPGNISGRARSIIVDPDDNTHKTWFIGSAGGGVWKTTNGGTNWTWITPNISNLATTSLAMAPTDHNTIYASSGEPFGNADAIVTGIGIFKSSDRGVTWNLLNSSTNIGVPSRVAVSPNSKDSVLVATTKGIYLSADGGVTWTQTHSERGSTYVQDLKWGGGSTFYAAFNSAGILKSVNGGRTWSVIFKPNGNAGRIEVNVSPTNNNYVAASCEGTLNGVNTDLYLSKDGGKTWSLLNMQLAEKTLNYLGSQGWYDNTLAFSPFDEKVIFVGGIGVYQITVPASGTSTEVISFDLQNNTPFVSLINFSANSASGRLNSTQLASKTNTIEIRFGAGINQMAHRFLTPVGTTSGVADANYSYADYVQVPFQVWDVTANRQLMVSFRDQNRNGKFDLIESNTSDSDATKQSREYIFISNATYSTTASTTIATAGGFTNGLTFQNKW